MRPLFLIFFHVVFSPWSLGCSNLTNQLRDHCNHVGGRIPRSFQLPRIRCGRCRAISPQALASRASDLNPGAKSAIAQLHGHGYSINIQREPFICIIQISLRHNQFVVVFVLPIHCRNRQFTFTHQHPHKLSRPQKKSHHARQNSTATHRNSSARFVSQALTSKHEVCH